MAEQFLARDVYPTWKRGLQDARATAWILTPYLDHSLVRLLENAGDQVRLLVVTDLAPEAGPANYRKKLLALKKLVERGTEVRTLPRLHAKVLVIDGDHLIAGSQNFTSYARSSKEVTAVGDRESKRALETLARWMVEARPIDSELVDRLLDATGDQAILVDAAIADLQSLVIDSVTAVDMERAEAAERERNEEFSQEAARALGSRVASTPWRVAMGTAHLVPDTATTHSEWYGRDEYPTMFGANQWGDRSGVDLTRWSRGHGDRRETLVLRHLHFYPVIHLPAGRLVFARIAQTRITYVKRGVRFASAQDVSGVPRHLGITFPERLTKGANMIVEVRPWGESSTEHQIGLQFNGETYEVRWDKPATGPWSAQANAAASAVLVEFGDPHRGPELLEKLLQPIKFSELGRDNKNAAAFFRHKRHELKLIDYGNAHLFVGSKL